jgi:hypothetical protein
MRRRPKQRRMRFQLDRAKQEIEKMCERTRRLSDAARNRAI